MVGNSPLGPRFPIFTFHKIPVIGQQSSTQPDCFEKLNKWGQNPLSAFYGHCSNAKPDSDPTYFPQLCHVPTPPSESQRD